MTLVIVSIAIVAFAFVTGWRAGYYCGKHDGKKERMTKFLILVALLPLFGCARYYTVQEDLSYEKGQPVRQITTRVTAYTLFNAKSEITKSKTLQSDKSQSSSVGSLSLSATNHVVDALREINGILEKVKTP